MKTTRNERVVLVEDQSEVREMMAVLLELWGYEVYAAASGQEGHELIAKTRPMTALVDIGLPDIDGYEVARRVRASVGDAVYLCALTGYCSPDEAATAREAGFDEYLSKPVAPGALKQVLSSVER